MVRQIVLLSLWLLVFSACASQSTANKGNRALHRAPAIATPPSKGARRLSPNARRRRPRRVPET